jgi:predicted phage-related endonuclease
MSERAIHLPIVSGAPWDRRAFIGGSDARIIMGNDEAVLVRLWREKRGEANPPDYSANLVVQLGLATESLNRRWYERTTGQVIKDAQSWARHPVIRWMAATLDGVVESTGAIFEAKFMLPWSFSEEAAAEKHMPQVQHNMWVTNATAAALSIITGGGKWVEVKITADPLYQYLLLTAEKKFWRCVESGEPPSPLWRRATAGPGSGGPDRRHELVKCVGGILERVSADQRGLPRARECQGGAQGPHARGR